LDSAEAWWRCVVAIPKPEHYAEKARPVGAGRKTFVAEAAVSSKGSSVGGYTAGTSGAMMHDCVH